MIEKANEREGWGGEKEIEKARNKMREKRVNERIKKRETKE